jgi:hypothetical protein
MAMALKASGLATDLITCVAVDDDNTIKDFMGYTITLGSGVAASVSTATWKGTSRRYFVTTDNTTADFYGVEFTATRPPIDEDVGISVWFACAGASAPTDASVPGPFVAIGGGGTNQRGVLRGVSANPVTYSTLGGSPYAVTSTSVPTDGSTKFSLGITYKNATSSTALYGLESGSLALEDTEGSDGGGWGGATTVWNIGGCNGNGNQPFKPFIVCVFDRLLSEAEYQSLHNDWYGTLFEAPAGSVMTRGVKQLTGGMQNLSGGTT